MNGFTLDEYNNLIIIIYNNKAFAHFHLFTDFLSSWEREDGGRSGGSGDEFALREHKEIM